MAGLLPLVFALTSNESRNCGFWLMCASSPPDFWTNVPTAVSLSGVGGLGGLGCAGASLMLVCRCWSRAGLRQTLADISIAHAVVWRSFSSSSPSLGGLRTRGRVGSDLLHNAAPVFVQRPRNLPPPPPPPLILLPCRMSSQPEEREGSMFQLSLVV